MHFVCAYLEQRAGSFIPVQFPADVCVSEFFLSLMLQEALLLLANIICIFFMIAGYCILVECICGRQQCNGMSNRKKYNVINIVCLHDDALCTMHIANAMRRAQCLYKYIFYNTRGRGRGRVSLNTLYLPSSISPSAPALRTNDLLSL